jgi:hypothetical protein
VKIDPEKDVGYGFPAALAGFPGLHQGRHVFRRPLSRKGWNKLANKWPPFGSLWLAG